MTMPDINSRSDKILITGGTSGLGLELVRLFKQKGSFVVATGRNRTALQEDEKLAFCRIDLSDMSQTVVAVKEIIRNYHFNIIINNAGIISPKCYQLTNDGFEQTLQVNFLSHLLMNEYIIRHLGDQDQLMIVTVISPAYRLVGSGKLLSFFEKENYRPLRAYSASKMCLALMCSYLPDKHPGKRIKCVAYIPGVFRSDIFRMQNHFLRKLYKIASPFMTNPSREARNISEILAEENFNSRYAFHSKNRPVIGPAIDNAERDLLFERFYSLIDPFFLE